MTRTLNVPTTARATQNGQQWTARAQYDPPLLAVSVICLTWPPKVRTLQMLHQLRHRHFHTVAGCCNFNGGHPAASSSFGPSSDGSARRVNRFRPCRQADAAGGDDAGPALSFTILVRRGGSSRQLPRWPVRVCVVLGLSPSG